ncbi:DUF2969 domain-containing protein [Enterococcus faecalis]
MSKKNKEIEVRVVEEQASVQDTNAVISKLMIGKKEIGRIIPQSGKKFVIEIDGKMEGNVKSLDEAFEYVIRQWNLND